MREILLGYQNEIASAAIFEEGQLCAFLQEQPETTVQKEQIYRARITQKAKGMRAVFAVLPNEEYVFVENCDKAVGCSILVQIKREAVGEKYALATTEISLLGHYCVLHQKKSGVTVSKKITDSTEIEQLRTLGLAMANQYGFGITFRTVAPLATEEELREELQQLYTQLQNVLLLGEQDGAPMLLSAGMPFWRKVMREYFDDTVACILVDGVALYQELCNLFSNHKMPFRLHTGEFGLFALYSVETELRKAFSRTIWLKSGAYLVIDETEAMTVIDVNSGKYSKKKEFDAMADVVNREAAIEITRLLRLRNIRGIVIVDFLKWEKKEAQEAFLQFFKEHLKAEKGKTELVDMTALGLVELTRRAD